MPDDADGNAPVPESSRRRRSVRRLLFVIASAHIGWFVGSAVPCFGFTGDVFSVLLILVAVPN